MAKTILAPSLSERVYSGTHGNESVAEGVFTVNAAEQETVINLLSHCRLAFALMGSN
ncbi:Uncharacterised protein [Escherichia coli]|nr:Uncharacterised protein [Escherichia coli]